MTAMRTLVPALAAMLFATGPLVAAPARDWSKVAVRQPDGDFVQGNPNAKVKLVEYLSFTCPHCAKMEAEAIAPLTAGYIRAGRVSYEVRHALRDGYDLTATLLARCAGPRPFFAVAPAVYAAQDKWMTQAGKWLESKPAVDGLPPEQLLPKLAQGSGLDALFAARGLSPARARACLTAAPERDRLGKRADAIWQQPGFPGTPAFEINGRRLDQVSDWAGLKGAIDQALR